MCLSSDFWQAFIPAMATPAAVESEMANLTDLWETPRDRREQWTKLMEQLLVRVPRSVIEQQRGMDASSTAVLRGQWPDGDPVNTMGRLRVQVVAAHNDMHTEKRLIQEDVLPYVRTLGRALGVDVDIQDTTAYMPTSVAMDTLEAMTHISVAELQQRADALKAPDNSQLVVILLLGDKFGGPVLPPLIPEPSMRKLLQAAATEDATVLRRWYAKDDNAVPQAYRVAKEKVPKGQWNTTIAPRVMTALTSAIANAGPNDPSLQKLQGSLLSRTCTAVGLDPENTEPADIDLNIFRRMITSKYGAGAVGGDTQMTGGVIQNLVDADETSAAALAALRDNCLLKECEPRSMKTYEVELGPLGMTTAHHASYYTALADDVTTALLARVAQAASNALSSEVVVEAATHMQMATKHILPEDTATMHTEATHRAVAHAMDNDGHPVMLVTGPPGCGLTAITADIAVTLATQSQGANTVVITRFIGKTLDSSSTGRLLRSVTQQLAALGIGETTDQGYPAESYDALRAEFASRLASSDVNVPIAIILDGYESIHSVHGRGKSLDWIPRDLPANVRILITCHTDAAVIAAAAQHWGNGIVRCEVGVLQRPEIAKLLMVKLKEEDETGNSRKLTSTQSERVIEAASAAGGVPLFVQVAAHAARNWSSDQPDTATVLPRSLRSLVTSLFAHLCRKYDARYVRPALAMITASRYGLSDQEMLDLLSLDTDAINAASSKWGKGQAAPLRFPPIYWLQLRYELGPLLGDVSAGGGVWTRSWAHQSIASVARSFFLPDDATSKTAYKALVYYWQGDQGSTAERRYRHIDEQPMAFASGQSGGAPGLLNGRRAAELPFCLMALGSTTQASFDALSKFFATSPREACIGAWAIDDSAVARGAWLATMNAAAAAPLGQEPWAAEVRLWRYVSDPTAAASGDTLRKDDKGNSLNSTMNSTTGRESENKHTGGWGLSSVKLSKNALSKKNSGVKNEGGKIDKSMEAHQLSSVERKVADLLDAGEEAVRAQLIDSELAVAQSYRNMTQQEKDAKVAESAENLGLLLRAQGRFQESIGLLDQALAMWKKAYGAVDPKVARAANNVGMTFVAAGDHAAAMPYLEQSLRCKESLHGAFSVEVADALIRLSGAQRGALRVKMAIQSLEIALSVRDTVLGRDHDDTAATCTQLGACLHADGHSEEALVYLSRVVRIRERRYGPGSVEVATACTHLGLLLRALGNHQEAIAQLRRSLFIRETKLGATHALTGRCCGHLGQLLLLVGSTGEAWELLKREEDINIAIANAAEADGEQAVEDVDPEEARAEKLAHQRLKEAQYGALAKKDAASTPSPYTGPLRVVNKSTAIIPKGKRGRNVLRLREKLMAQFTNSKAAFDHFDKNGNGQLNGTEFRTTIRNLGFGFSENDLRELMKTVERDSGGMGYISLEEFEHFFAFETEAEEEEPAAEPPMPELSEAAANVDELKRDDASHSVTGAKPKGKLKSKRIDADAIPTVTDESFGLSPAFVGNGHVNHNVAVTAGAAPTKTKKSPAAPVHPPSNNKSPRAGLAKDDSPATSILSPASAAKATKVFEAEVDEASPPPKPVVEVEEPPVQPMDQLLAAKQRQSFAADQVILAAARAAEDSIRLTMQRTVVMSPKGGGLGPLREADDTLVEPEAELNKSEQEMADAIAMFRDVLKINFQTYAHAFEWFDFDKVGSVSKARLRELLPKAGFKGQRHEVDALMRAIDTKCADNHITANTFEQIVAFYNNPRGEDTMPHSEIISSNAIMEANGWPKPQHPQQVPRGPRTVAGSNASGATSPDAMSPSGPMTVPKRHTNIKPDIAVLFKRVTKALQHNFDSPGAAFGVFDRNTNGELDAKEFAQCVQNLGAGFSAMELKQMLMHMEESRQGYVSQADFLRLFAYSGDGSTEAATAAAYPPPPQGPRPAGAPHRGPKHVNEVDEETKRMQAEVEAMCLAAAEKAGLPPPVTSRRVRQKPHVSGSGAVQSDTTTRASVVQRPGQQHLHRPGPPPAPDRGTQRNGEGGVVLPPIKQAAEAPPASANGSTVTTTTSPKPRGGNDTVVKTQGRQQQKIPREGPPLSRLRNDSGNGGIATESKPVGPRAARAKGGQVRGTVRGLIQSLDVATNPHLDKELRQQEREYRWSRT